MNSTSNIPVSQYEMLVRDRYQAYPLNITHPIGHHIISGFDKTCNLKIKKSKSCAGQIRRTE